MTIIEKLSDRNSFIFEAILMVLNNVSTQAKPTLSLPELQWELFKCGVSIKKDLLAQAISVMRQKGQLGPSPTNEKKEQNPPAIIQP